MKTLAPTATAALLVVTTCLLSVGSAEAQSSTSYRLDEHVLNSGGSPAAGTDLASSNFRITSSSLGEGMTRPRLQSASYRSDASFLSAYAPPGEVSGLQFTDEQTLAWNADLSAGTYSLYREPIGALSSGNYGQCLAQDLTSTTTTDPDAPVTGQGFFYLITAENRLHEEGTKGNDASGATRGGTACP